MKDKDLNILIVGVGGQGTLLASRVLGQIALHRGLDVKISEVHGKKFSKKWQGVDRAFLALYHPAAALYNGSMVAVLKDDFQKIPELLKEVEVRAETKQERLL